MWRCLRSTVHGSDLASVSWRTKSNPGFPHTWSQYPALRTVAFTATTFVATRASSSSNAPLPIVNAPDVHIPSKSTTCMQHERDNALALRRLLSPEQLLDHSSHSITLSSIQASYRQTILTGHLHLFKSSHITSLIQLFGSISTDNRFPHPPFSQPHAQLQERFLNVQFSDTSFAGFVLEVVGDKELSGRRLSNSDHYWAMRAALSALTNEETSTKKRSLLKLATKHYKYIWKHGPYAAVHEPFLRSILDHDWPSSSAVASRAVHNILERYHVIRGAQMVEIIWKVLLAGQRTFSADEKALLLNSLRKRIPTEDLSHTTESTASSTSDSDLAAVLSTTIFPSSHTPKSQSGALQWAIRTAQVALSPSLPLSIQWQNIMLAALSQVPDDSAVLDPADTKDITDHHLHPYQSRDWFTVYASALLQREAEGTAKLSPEFQQVVRSLWRLWKGPDDHVSHPKIVLRQIVRTFLAFSARIPDVLLLEGCLRFGVKHQLMHVSATDNAQAADAFLGQCISSWVSCHGRSLSSFGQAFDKVVHASDRTISATVVAGAVTRFYLRNQSPDLTHWYHFLQAEDIVLPLDLTTRLGIAFASSRLDWTMSIMQRELPTAHYRRLALAVCHALRAKRLQTMPRPWRFMLAKALSTTLDSREHIPKFDVRYALELLVNNGQARICVPVILAIHRSQPAFFPWPYCRRLLSTLLKQRRNKLAMNLMELTTQWDTRRCVAFRRRLFMGLLKSGRSMHNVQFRKAIRLPRFQARNERLAQMGSQRRPNLTLVLASLGNAPSVTALTTAFRILAYGHRPVAARNLLSRFLPRLQKTSTPEQVDRIVTTLGNIFLNRLLRRKMIYKYNHSQQAHAKLLLGKFLVTRKWLREKYSFRDDGVTTVLVIKAILGWRRGMIAGNVRVLFDQILKRGWSLQGVTRVFSTRDDTSSAGIENLLGAGGSKLTFQRHIAPMYQLFIRGLVLRGDVQGAAVVSSLLESERRHAFNVVRSRQLQYNKRKCQ